MRVYRSVYSPCGPDGSQQNTRVDWSDINNDVIDDIRHILYRKLIVMSFSRNGIVVRLEDIIVSIEATTKGNNWASSFIIPYRNSIDEIIKYRMES